MLRQGSFTPSAPSATSTEPVSSPTNAVQFYGSKKGLLAVLKKVYPTSFVPSTLLELRIALHKIAFSQNPALKAKSVTPQAVR